MRKFMLSVATLALIAAPAFAGKYNKVLSIGDKAPDFSGIPATIKGEDTSLTLGDLKEDVVVVVFLGNHCPVVVAVEDRLNDFVQDYKGKSVKMVGIAVADLDSDRLPKIKDWVKEKGSQYVYGYDESQATGKAYGATNTPHFFVLDKDRVIRYMGALDDNHMSESKATKHYLRDAVDALLAGKEIKETETRPNGCGIQYTK
jgi:peroxiredoxin